MLLLAAFSLVVSASYCSRGQSSCWPTDAEVQELYNSLNPEMTRMLSWNGTDEARLTAVPIYSPGEQPLYGFASESSMEPVYVVNANPPDCFSSVTENRTECFVTVRNNPFNNTRPGFVVWALTAEHVQKAVQFAVAHNLCIAVAGTGHDFQSRHSCRDGIFIRTTLIKGMDFDTEDERGYGWAEGNVRAGAGIVFSEIHQAAAERGLIMSSGWAATVGIAGWTLGGGHGPIANYAGLGVDQLLEAEIVTADGSIIRANATHHSDLYWALRGGGGSTWGIITEFTLRTHKLPEGGITHFYVSATGDYCTWKFWKNGKNDRNTLIDNYFDWSLTNDKHWSGLSFITPYEDFFWNCDAGWQFEANYWFFGPKEDGLAQWEKLTKDAMGHIRDMNVTITSLANMWEDIQVQPLQPIIPTNWLPTGVMSVLVSREKTEAGDLATVVKERMDASKELKFWNQLQLYQDITGNLNAPQQDSVAISPSFRTALFHFVFGWVNEPSIYALGENSYMNEMAYSPPDAWQTRQWGSFYDRLLAVKKKYDPNNVFWCRHCVGDDETLAMIKALGTVAAAQFA